VNLDLLGKQTIAWARPAKCPAGMEPANVTIGPEDAGMGLEVAARAQANRMHAELVVNWADGRILRRDSDGGDPARRPG
jgi:hypothetical protein